MMMKIKLVLCTYNGIIRSHHNISYRKLRLNMIVGTYILKHGITENKFPYMNYGTLFITKNVQQKYSVFSTIFSVTVCNIAVCMHAFIYIYI